MARSGEPTRFNQALIDIYSYTNIGYIYVMNRVRSANTYAHIKTVKFDKRITNKIKI